MQPPIDGLVPYDKVAYNDIIHPATTISQTEEIDYSAVYIGMPDQWSGFGDKSVVLKVDGANSMRAAIQTFFDGNAYNNPGQTVPNFYYYYNQIYPSPGQYSNWQTLTSSEPPYTIYIADSAYDGGGVYPVNVHHWVPGGSLIHFYGSLGISGLHDWIFTCAHEKAHQDDYISGVLRWDRSRADSGPDGDLDLDGLSNSWEEQHFLDPEVSDTTGAYPLAASSSSGDCECIADLRGLGVLLAHKADWRKDWAQPGLQWGLWGPGDPGYCGLFGLTEPVYPFHPWSRSPAEEQPPGEPTTFPDLPGDELTYIPP